MSDEARRLVTLIRRCRASLADGDAMSRWITIVTIAEALGFAFAAGVAISVVIAEPPSALAFAVTVLGGAIEGAALGAGQWLAMSGHRPPPRRWIAATSLGAAIAWSIGMLPSTLGLAFGSPATYVALAVGGVVLLASIPSLQWFALDRRGVARWVPVNMGAWAAAALWTAAPSPFIDEMSPVWVVATLYVIAGVLMALTVATLTARTAARMFPAE